MCYARLHATVFCCLLECIPWKVHNQFLEGLLGILYVGMLSSKFVVYCTRMHFAC